MWGAGEATGGPGGGTPAPDFCSKRILWLKVENGLKAESDETGGCCGNPGMDGGSVK